jgi:hypothetical protein
MQIFQQERDDGLEAKISSSASISYASVAEPCLLNNTELKNIKSFASLVDSDLYYVQSILVSSSWNKNDDIFDPEEVWAARNTPEDKPTNLEHDENLIIGHITGNWPITEDGYIIDENTSPQDLPEKYHILTGSVIYRAFSSNELKDRSEKLIAEIEDGNKFVSMECFFKGFDYGLIHKSTGEYKVLSRNDSTAYLTKHLRAYGGLGEHDDYKIGRVLRNITFSGKGFVDKPANPDSIIFNKEMLNKLSVKKIDDLTETGVSNNQSTLNVENNTMSVDLETVLTDVAELKNKIENITTASETIQEAHDVAAQLENTIKDKEAIIVETQAALDLMKVEKEEAAKKMEEDMKKKEEDMKKKEEEMTKVKSELETANEIIATYKNKEEEMAKKEKKMKRMASLLNYGFDNEACEATVEKFESLSDEAFDAMTSLFAGKMPPWLLDKYKKDEESKDTKKEEKKKASEDNVADSSVLENVEVEHSVNLSVSGESSSVDSTRAELIEFVCARLGKKLNKGE